MQPMQGGVDLDKLVWVGTCRESVLTVLEARSILTYNVLLKGSSYSQRPALICWPSRQSVGPSNASVAAFCRFKADESVDTEAEYFFLLCSRNNDCEFA